MKNSNQTADQKLLDYYRIAPGSLAGTTAAAGGPYGESGFFQFRGQTCYGQCRSGTASDVVMAKQFDASEHALCGGSTLQLPFNFAEVVDNLRLERYRQGIAPGNEAFTRSELITKLYYLVRSALPVSLRRQLQKAYFRNWKMFPFPTWPVDFTVDSLHQELLRLLMETSR